MALKNTTTTSDYLPWDTMLTLVRKLYRDGDFRMSLLIGCGSFFGLRISDLRLLTWGQLLDNDTITHTMKKLRTFCHHHAFKHYLKNVVQAIFTLCVLAH